MGRRGTCNELISTEQRERVIELFIGSNQTYYHISTETGVPIDKIKNMTTGLQRPRKTGPISNSEFNALMAGWAPVGR